MCQVFKNHKSKKLILKSFKLYSILANTVKSFLYFLPYLIAVSIPIFKFISSNYSLGISYAYHLVFVALL